MSELIESSEFGDWLMSEITQAGGPPTPANPDAAPTTSARLEALQIAKVILLEFLTLQHAMLNAASAARRQQDLCSPAIGPNSPART